MTAWIRTYSGARYYPAAPRPEDVRIVDIAHHLSMLCRFTGAVRRFYSVAEHSVLVSRMVHPDLAFQALMHDATEAYINDIASPLKRSWLMWGYRRIERRNWLAIAKWFRLPENLHPDVHAADRAALDAEEAALMYCDPWAADTPQQAILTSAEVRCLAPEIAERAFLDRFYDLTWIMARRGA